jgi:hypothetical protein
MSNAQVNNKFLDLSGFGISGKGAFIDLLREFDNYDTPRPDFEFGLIRIKDGLLDLKCSLVDNWSPVRSDVSIKRFKEVILDLGKSPSRLNFPKALIVSGGRYDDMFGGKFIELSNKYVDSLIDDSYNGLRVYPMQDNGIFSRVSKKFLYKLRFKKVYYSKIYISCGKEFETKTKKYLHELFRARNAANNVTHVMFNAFEPFNPIESIELFFDAKIIIIDRDPRDIYLSALNHNLPNDVPRDLDIFIKRYKMLRKQVKSKDDNRVMRLNFEDLVLNYQDTLNALFIFLEEDPLVHKYPKKYFNPEISKKGIGLWKNSKGKLKKDVNVIYSELREYCLEL